MGELTSYSFSITVGGNCRVNYLKGGPIYRLRLICAACSSAKPTSARLFSRFIYTYIFNSCIPILMEYCLFMLHRYSKISLSRDILAQGCPNREYLSALQQLGIARIHHNPTYCRGSRDT